MACIGKQSQRVREDAEDDLNHHKTEIQRGADGKRSSEIFRRMTVAQTAVVMIVMPIVIVIVVVVAILTAWMKVLVVIVWHVD